MSAKKTTEGAVAGRIITCFPARGGAGTTTIAVNLAGQLAARGRSAVVIDLDQHLGDVPLLLDLDPSYGLADVLANLDRLDGELLRTSLASHRSGVFVVGQRGGVDAAEVSPEDTRRVIGFLRLHFDFVIVDGVRGFDESALLALDASDCIVLVLAQDVPSVKNARRCLDVLHRLGCPDERVVPVVNRVVRRAPPIEIGAIEEHLGVRVAARIANDFPVVIDAINRGRLLEEAAPRAQVTRDLAALSKMLQGGDAVPASRGLLDRLLRRNKAA